tara:strand:- start:965 stop:1201 length:237 start_codon:yes stop_codon:yes gene_type:complete
MMAEGVPVPVVNAVIPIVEAVEVKAVKTVKRKASAYSKKYGRAFKKVAGKYKLKSGAWAKNGFKRAQKEAHKLAKGMK